MNLGALRIELDGDPEGLGYGPLATVGDHAGIAALLNRADRPGKRAVSAKAIQRHLILNGLWAPVKAAAKAGNPVAETVLDALAAFEDFDFADPEVMAAATAMLDGLVAGSVITDGQKAGVLALAAGLLSRSEELFGAGTRVRHDDVTGALHG